VLSLAAAVVAIGCGGPTTLTASPGSSSEASAAATVEIGAAVVDRLLDPTSRDLLTVVEPEEDIEATLTVADASRVVEAATATGLRARVVSDDMAFVAGPIGTVLEFAAEAQPTAIHVDEDRRANRWLPSTEPTIQVPTSGSPYRLVQLQVDRSDLKMSPELQVPLLQLLAVSIVTVDGAPYDRIEVSGECSGRQPSCALNATGSSRAAGGRLDQYLVLSDAATNVAPHVDSRLLGAVPRRLTRAAEWLARHDPPASAAIAAFDDWNDAQWDPGQPGRIELTYTRPCTGSVRPSDRQMAETGECLDILAVTVDLASGLVSSIQRKR
jgi:hypothetical protein